MTADEQRKARIAELQAEIAAHMAEDDEPSPAEAHGDEFERLIAAQERVDQLRRALEIIAVGDSQDPVTDAGDELVALGYWDGDALAAARAADAKTNVQPKGKEPVDALAQLGAALDWITNGVKLHANTAYLVASFARALAEKLSRAEVKYGYSDGWMQHDWMDECRAQLLEHVAKGDPRDVAAYCAFLWHHGQSTAAPATQAPAPGAVAGGYKQAPGSKNCMQSAVAYMLGLPMEAVPDFEKAGPHAWDLFEQFFDERGFSAEMFPPNVEIAGDYLASGPTERGTSHMVVMRGGELLHDPHPSNAGLTSPQVVWVIARKAGPPPAVGPRRVSDEEVQAWVTRHDFGASLCLGDYRAMVEDARTIELAVHGSQPPVQKTGGA